MHQSPSSRKAVIVLCSCLGLWSCSPSTNPEVFRNSFVPPAPKPSTAPPIVHRDPEPVIVDPPSLHAAAVPPKDVPNFLKTEPQLAPRPQLDNRIKRAEKHFATGRKLYLEGDAAGARAEFDKAIETLLNAPESAPDRFVAEKRIEEYVDRIHRFDVEGMGAGQLEDTVNYDKSPLQEILDLTFPIDPNLKSRVKDQVAATRSQLPLEENDEVLRYINYFNSDRGKRTIIGAMKRSGRYRDMIRRILDEEGVPQELIFLAQAESGFLPRALSYKAAVGMWQFVKWRGNEYGLKQTPYSDDRLDPELATRAGARHLRDLYHEFGDWYLAMAAYNCGPGCVGRAVERTGYADFWQLRSRNALPKETSNYVPLIVAMTIIVKNAKDYGIEDVQMEPAIVYDTVEMVANTNLSLIADLLDVPQTELRELNPALLKGIAPAGYAMRIPKGSTQSLMSSLSLIPPDKRASWRAHRVLEGEDIASISKRYRTPSNSLASVNRANLDDLRTGDLVVIPAAYSEPKPVTVAAPKTATKKQAVRRTAPAKAPVRKVSAPAPARKAPVKRASAGVVVAQSSQPKARPAAR
ncbi:MAG: transglycosylase SLT domain-containing protein [Acidobacteria bacterium]|nr:transglycosylase SLT domain-containing protein [Acidobacteriota bacterium]